MGDDSYKVLIGPAFMTSSGSTLGTVPAGKSWIARNWVAINTDSSARTFGIYNSTSGALTAQFQITPSALSVDAGGMAEWDGAKAFEAGRTIALAASVGSKITFEMSGDEYSS